MRPPQNPPAPALPADEQFLAFIRAQVPSARGPIAPPESREAWDRRLAVVRAGLARSFGRMPAEPCPLDPEILGTLRRDGYVIERLTFQSRPGVRVTANLYRPDPAPDRAPAVLNVHGHWAWARIDPHVQARCLGLVKLGYVALAVDAFGAGERAIEPGPGTYHGGLVGASLWPAGVSLMGLQVYDNRRAVDYLISRPEVDASRLAITGASGGGNQSMYAGATDERLRAVVPVCGVGRYEAYLGTACCVCEVNAGGLTYATTGDLLAMVAPRALMVINATRDAIQFSVGEAARSIEYARARYRRLEGDAEDAAGRVERLRHVAIESGHDYNRTMREAMYGWLDLHLRGRGDGSPVPEPSFKEEDPKDLRCYPDGKSRPRTVATIPEFARREGRLRLSALPPAPDHPQRWEADAGRMKAILRQDVLGGLPDLPDGHVLVTRDDAGGRSGQAFTLSPEPGLTLRGRLLTPPGDRWAGSVLLLRYEGMAPADDPLVKGLLASGRRVLTADLRATGAGKPKTGAVAGVPDHHEAEWGLWIGRPLLGQWAWDARMWLDALASLPTAGPAAADDPAPEARPRGPAVLGVGPFGLVALLAGAMADPSPVAAVGLLNPPVSLVGPGPWKDLLMGLLAPYLLDVGDVGHLAALSAPRPLTIAGGVEPDGGAAGADRLGDAFGFTRSVYRALDAGPRLTLSPRGDLATLLAGWRT